MLVDVKREKSGEIGEKYTTSLTKMKFLCAMAKKDSEKIITG